MAHIFLQEHPKVSVGDANDAPSTIPTPEQLGSLLITYTATGATIQGAVAHAALEIGGTAQWVPIVGATGPTGIAPVNLSGTLGNDVASGPGDAIGTRPLASSLPVGSTWTAEDAYYSGVVIFQPTLGQNVWSPMFETRLDTTATTSLSGGAVTTTRLGVYDPVTRVYTQCAVSGQFCNARANGSQATPGGAISITLGPGSTFSTVGGTALGIGDEVMVDGTGLLVPYVVAPGNVPYGRMASIVAAGGTGTAVRYDY